MAGVVQRLIRWIWGTIASPASIDNKQASFNEGDNGSGRDRTQLVSKGPTGTPHVFITLDEVEDYVAAQLSGSASSASPYVIVSSLNDYVAAMENTLVQNIWCDDGTGRGLLIDPVSVNIDVINSKNIYGAGGYSLYLASGASKNFTITYPVADNGNDIKIKFFDTLSFNGSTVTTGGIVALGGYAGNSYELNFASIEVATDSIDLRAGDADTDLHGKVLYEVIESELSTPLTVSGVDEPVNTLWSGKNTQLKTSSDDTITPSTRQVVAKEVGLIYTSQIQDATQSLTTDNATASRDYHWNDEVYTKDLTFRKNEFATGVNRPAARIYSMFKHGATSLTDAFGFSGDGQVFVGDTGIDPWTPGIQVTQIGYMSRYSYDDGNKVSGIAYGCYYDGSWWRRSELNLDIRIEEIVDGVKSIYRADGGIALTTIILEDVTPYMPISSFLSDITAGSGTVITGFAPIKSGHYQFTFNVNIGFPGSVANEGATFHIRQNGTIYAYCGADQNTADAGNKSCSVSVTLEITDLVNSVEVYLSSKTGSVSLTEPYFGVEYKGEL